MSDQCDRIQRRLVKLHLTKLPVSGDPEVGAHLAACPTCRVYRDHLNFEHKELEDFAESLDSYVDDVQDKLHRHIQENHPPDRNLAVSRQ